MVVSAVAAFYCVISPAGSTAITYDATEIQVSNPGAGLVISNGNTLLTNNVESTEATNSTRNNYSSIRPFTDIENNRLTSSSSNNTTLEERYEARMVATENLDIGETVNGSGNVYAMGDDGLSAESETEQDFGLEMAYGSAQSSVPVISAVRNGSIQTDSDSESNRVQTDEFAATSEEPLQMHESINGGGRVYSRGDDALNDMVDDTESDFELEHACRHVGHHGAKHVLQNMFCKHRARKQ